MHQIISISRFLVVLVVPGSLLLKLLHICSYWLERFVRMLEVIQTHWPLSSDTVGEFEYSDSHMCF